LRINGKLATNIETLNAKVKFAVQNTNNNTVLLELSFDRIDALSKLPDSVLLNPLVYPSVHIYIQKGNEDRDVAELKKSLQPLKQFSNLQIVVTLGICRPIPKMDAMMQLIRSHKGLIRFIILDMERVPNNIMKQFDSYVYCFELILSSLFLIESLLTTTLHLILF